MSGAASRNKKPAAAVAIPARVDCLQYCDISPARFREMRAGGLHAAHATVCYRENFLETARNIFQWREMFRRHCDLIMPGLSAEDVFAARDSGRTAIFFGAQNCSAAEGDPRMISVLHFTGARFMQLTYNRKTAFAGGCLDKTDGGVSEAGRAAIWEMNRLGMVLDLSHIGERSFFEAIKISRRPPAVTHANPKFWLDIPRNLSDSALRALSEAGGMLGLSLYPHHLRGGSKCALRSFCEMTARLAEITGAENIGIGSDLCRGRPDTVLAWMREGKHWKKKMEKPPAFPPQPKWFRSAADFGNLAEGLAAAGFNAKECEGILGENWLRFFIKSFPPQR